MLIALLITELKLDFLLLNRMRGFLLVLNEHVLFCYDCQQFSSEL